MKKSIFYFLLFVLISCQRGDSDNQNKSEDEVKSESRKGIKVQVTTITDTIFQNQLISNGKIQAVQKSDLRFNTNESVSKINIVNGQLVEKGKVLGILKNELLHTQLEKAKIDLEKAENQLRIEKINYGTSQDGKINPTVLKNLQIKSGYFEAKNALENAKIQYDQTFIRAPFRGNVANLEIKEGDYISSSDVFVTLINTDHLEVTFSILETELNFVEKNQTIEIIPFSNPDDKYTGNITEINPLVDENGLIKIKASVTSKTDRLFDGMNAKVLVSRPLNDVVVVPKSALVLRSNREVIFTYEKGVAKWNYVELAGENSDSYAIKKGLKRTDSLIVSGNLNLAHDAKVFLAN